MTRWDLYPVTFPVTDTSIWFMNIFAHNRLFQKFDGSHFQKNVDWFIFLNLLMVFQSKLKLFYQLKIHVLQFLCAKIHFIPLFNYSNTVKTINAPIKLLIDMNGFNFNIFWFDRAKMNAQKYHMNHCLICSKIKFWGWRGFN